MCDCLTAVEQKRTSGWNQHRAMCLESCATSDPLMMFSCTFGSFCSKFLRAAKERVMFNTLQLKQSPSTAILGIVSSAACAASSCDWDSLWRRGSASNTCKVQNNFGILWNHETIWNPYLPVPWYTKGKTKAAMTELLKQVEMCNICQDGPWSSSASLWSFFTCALFAWRKLATIQAVWSSNFWSATESHLPESYAPKRATNVCWSKIEWLK